LLGLAGTYTQILTEKRPNVRGIASKFGLSHIPGPWMESIQISKGVASVQTGYEAMTGQINVEYKKT
jgi:outer membrane receptor for ferrienterochelin and colicins